MKANTKKYLKVLTSIGLVLAVAVGFTLAYLTADTGEKVNSFTGSNNITGKTTETEWEHEDGWDYYPGQVAAKNPTVKINGDENAWVGMTIKVIDKTEDPENGVEISLADFIKDYGSFQIKNGEDLIDGMNVSNRERPIDTPTKWTAVDDGFYVYNSIVTAGTSANPIFDAVKINAGIYKLYEKTTGSETVYIYDVDPVTGEEIAGTRVEVDNKTWVRENQVLVNSNGDVINEMKLPVFEIVAHGYAVQSTLSFDEAITELSKLAK